MPKRNSAGAGGGQRCPFERVLQAERTQHPGHRHAKTEHDVAAAGAEPADAFVGNLAPADDRIGRDVRRDPAVGDVAEHTQAADCPRIEPGAQAGRIAPVASEIDLHLVPQQRRVGEDHFPIPRSGPQGHERVSLTGAHHLLGAGPGVGQITDRELGARRHQPHRIGQEAGDAAVRFAHTEGWCGRVEDDGDRLRGACGRPDERGDRSSRSGASDQGAPGNGHGFRSSRRRPGLAIARQGGDHRRSAISLQPAGQRDLGTRLPDLRKPVIDPATI